LLNDNAEAIYICLRPGRNPACFKLIYEILSRIIDMRIDDRVQESYFMPISALMEIILFWNQSLFSGFQELLMF